MHHKADLDIFLINTGDKLNYKVTNPYGLFFSFVLTITFYYYHFLKGSLMNFALSNPLNENSAAVMT